MLGASSIIPIYMTHTCEGGPGTGHSRGSFDPSHPHLAPSNGQRGWWIRTLIFIIVNPDTK